MMCTYQAHDFWILPKKIIFLCFLTKNEKFLIFFLKHFQTSKCLFSASFYPFLLKSKYVGGLECSFRYFWGNAYFEKYVHTKGTKYWFFHKLKRKSLNSSKLCVFCHDILKRSATFPGRSKIRHWNSKIFWFQPKRMKTRE